MASPTGDFVHLPEPSKAQPRLRTSSLTLPNLIAFLTSPEAKRVIKAKGLEPA